MPSSAHSRDPIAACIRKPVIPSSHTFPHFKITPYPVPQYLKVYILTVKQVRCDIITLELGKNKETVKCDIQ
jgi:hypothetical protein